MSLLKSRSPKCIYNVNQFVVDKFSLRLSDEQILKIFSEPQDFWDEIEFIDKISHENVRGKVLVFIYHNVYSRITGKIAPHELKDEQKDELKRKAGRMNWKDDLHNYIDVIRESIR